MTFTYQLGKFMEFRKNCCKAEFVACCDERGRPQRSSVPDSAMRSAPIDVLAPFCVSRTCQEYHVITDIKSTIVLFRVFRAGCSFDDCNTFGMRSVLA